MIFLLWKFSFWWVKIAGMVVWTILILAVLLRELFMRPNYILSHTSRKKGQIEQIFYIKIQISEKFLPSIPINIRAPSCTSFRLCKCLRYLFYANGSSIFINDPHVFRCISFVFNVSISFHLWYKKMWLNSLEYLEEK